MTPSQIKLVIRQAERAVQKAQRAVVEADAVVSTYWINSGLTPAPFWLSGNLRESINLSGSLAHQLYLTASKHLPAKDGQ